MSVLLLPRCRSPEFIGQSHTAHKPEEYVPRVGSAEDPDHRADKEGAPADKDYDPSLLGAHLRLYLPSLHHLSRAYGLNPFLSSVELRAEPQPDTFKRLFGTSSKRGDEHTDVFPSRCSWGGP